MLASPSPFLTISRLSPYVFACGLRLRNRVVVPPMASATADERGYATPETLAHYDRLGASGAALVFAEYSFVEEAGRSEPNQLGAHDNACLDGLARIAGAIARHGAVAGLQITHAGGKSTRALTGGHLQGPSGVAVPVPSRDPETPDAMTAADAARWADAFVDAALRAEAAGFAFVELHAAHGYGLNQWVSPLTNLREDALGGSSEGRARLLLSIVARIRRSAPRLMISVRFPGRDFLEGGLDAHHAAALAGDLADAGVSLFNVSSGLGGWRRPRDREGEGFLVPEAAALQSALGPRGVPVVGVGGIESAAYADAVLARGEVQFVAVGRAILEGREGALRLTPTRRDRD